MKKIVIFEVKTLNYLHTSLEAELGGFNVILFCKFVSFKDPIHAGSAL
jgi:hypothetical protein